MIEKLVYKMLTFFFPVSIAAVTDPKVLIEGVLFRARYLGSTQLVSPTFLVLSLTLLDFLASQSY